MKLVKNVVLESTTKTLYIRGRRDKLYSKFEVLAKLWPVYNEYEFVMLDGKKYIRPVFENGIRYSYNPLFDGSIEPYEENLTLFARFANTPENDDDIMNFVKKYGLLWVYSGNQINNRIGCESLESIKIELRAFKKGFNIYKNLLHLLTTENKDEFFEEIKESFEIVNLQECFKLGDLSIEKLIDYLNFLNSDNFRSISKRVIEIDNKKEIAHKYGLFDDWSIDEKIERVIEVMEDSLNQIYILSHFNEYVPGAKSIIFKPKLIETDPFIVASANEGINLYIESANEFLVKLIIYRLSKEKPYLSFNNAKIQTKQGLLKSPVPSIRFMSLCSCLWYQFYCVLQNHSELVPCKNQKCSNYVIKGSKKEYCCPGCKRNQNMRDYRKRKRVI